MVNFMVCHYITIMMLKKLRKNAMQVTLKYGHNGILKSHQDKILKVYSNIYIYFKSITFYLHV